MKDYYTLAEIAELMEVSHQHAGRVMSKAKVPRIEVNPRCYLYPKSEASRAVKRHARERSPK